MRFSSVILIFTLVIVLVTASTEINESYFESCSPNDWIIIFTTIEWKNETKHITVNITYNEIGHPIYEVNITIDDCQNHTSCIGEPQVKVATVDCNSKEQETDVCKIAKRIATLEIQREWLINRYGSQMAEEVEKSILYQDQLCINIADIKEEDNLEATKSKYKRSGE